MNNSRLVMGAAIVAIATVLLLVNGQMANQTVSGNLTSSNTSANQTAPANAAAVNNSAASNSTASNSTVNNTDANRTLTLQVLPQPNLTQANSTSNQTTTPNQTVVATQTVVNQTSPVNNTVNATPISSVAISAPGILSLGQQVQVAAIVSGGVGPYTYSYFEVVPGTTEAVAINSCAGVQEPVCTVSTASTDPSGRYSFYVVVGNPSGSTVTSDTAGVLVI